MSLEREWRQFAELGDMIGNGLHLEPDGKWIVKEYKALQRILIPDAAKAEREMKRKLIDSFVENGIKKHKCTCGGLLKQSRKGSYVVYCTECSKRYKYKRNNAKKN